MITAAAIWAIRRLAEVSEDTLVYESPDPVPSSREGVRDKTDTTSAEPAAEAVVAPAPSSVKAFDETTALALFSVDVEQPESGAPSDDYIFASAADMPFETEPPTGPAPDEVDAVSPVDITLIRERLGDLARKWRKRDAEAA
jgi:hypothetical protein